MILIILGSVVGGFILLLLIIFLVRFMKGQSVEDDEINTPGLKDVMKQHDISEEKNDMESRNLDSEGISINRDTQYSQSQSVADSNV